MIGHLLTPARLIPSSFIGGTIGILLGSYICYKIRSIDKKNLLPVLLFTLISFGAVSFVIAFNFNHPLLIVGGFFLIGLTGVLANRFFKRHPETSANNVYFVAGILLSLPALYFVMASLLKFQFGYGFFFNPIDGLLNRTNGQANFNAITPFLFGGGLLLSFFLNALAQVELVNKKQSLFPYRIVRLRINPLNLGALVLAGFTGIIIASYLVVENLR